MKLTAYTHRAQLITLSIELGNSLGKLASPLRDKPGEDEQVFENAIDLGDGAYALELPCTEEFAGVIQAMNENADISDPRLAYLVAHGLAEPAWIAAKASFMASVYRAWQEDGSFVSQPNALANLASANGYTLPAQ